MRNFAIFKLLFAVMLFSESAAFAQSVSFINIASDAKVMANAGISAVADASAFSFWNNSSNVALSNNRFGAGISYNLWQPDAGEYNHISAGAYARVNKFLSVTAGYKMFKNGGYDIYDQHGNKTGRFKPMEYLVGGGLAFRVLPVLSLSVDAEYIGSKIGSGVKGSAFAFNIGSTFRSDNFAAGISVNHLGGKIEYAEGVKYNLPSVLKCAAQYEFSFGEATHCIVPQAQVGATLYDMSYFGAVACNYIYDKIFNASIGYHLADNTKYIPSHLSAGIGVSYFGCMLNLAYFLAESSSPINGSFGISLQISL